MIAADETGCHDGGWSAIGLGRRYLGAAFDVSIKPASDPVS